MKQNNIEFKEKRIALSTETTAKELSQYNSDAKVPVLQDGNLVIWDSLSILEYISEKYLESKGWPEDERARAVAWSVSAEMHSSFFNVRNEMPMNCRKKFLNIGLSTCAKREIERIKALWKMCRSEYGAGGDWLFGSYTIADAMFAPVALRFEGYSVHLSGVEKTYVENVLKQPSIVEWVEAGKAEKVIIKGNEIENY